MAPKESSPNNTTSTTTTASKPLTGKHVVVMVLGDLGRSPRMQYHALSLANEGATVSLVGYKGELCVPPVEAHPNIRKYYVEPLAGKKLRSRSFLLFALVKVVSLVAQLLFTLLWSLPHPDAILVQTPPSLPTFAVAWFAASLRRASLVIDWHNLGFSVLALSLGKRRSHPLVRAMRWYESTMSRLAHHHLCVTQAMSTWLHNQFGISAAVLYDRPPSFFGPTDLEHKHDLLSRLEPQFKAFDVLDKFRQWGANLTDQDTVVSSRGADGKITSRPDRAALVVSSTSWTEDEDFSMLLKAMEMLDDKVKSSRTRPFPFVVVVVTGKGPQKAGYEAKIRALRLRCVACCTMWLEPEDYPRLIGSADLGVCLHTSTSGIDLPMKVVDMYGCNVPCCAVSFTCLSELVKHGVNGLVFRTESELADHMYDLLQSFQDPKGLLLRLRSGVQGMTRWEENWREHALPVLVEAARVPPARVGLLMLVNVVAWGVIIGIVTGILWYWSSPGPF